MAGRSIAVTQDDIDAGLRKNSSRCVVALAIARTVTGASGIIVDAHTVRFTTDGRRYTVLTPPRVADYVVAFDAGDTLHPFTFRLRDDQKLVQRRRKTTAKGTTAVNAEHKAKYRRRKLEQVENDPAATPAEKTVAADRYAAALADAAAARETPGPRTSPEDMSDLPPDEIVKPVTSKRTTIFHRNQRSYGRRVMRVNRLDDQPGDYRGPLDDDDDE